MSKIHSVSRRKPAVAAKAAPMELHPKLTPLAAQLPGPFVHRPGGGVLTVDDHQSLVSRDHGKTWKARPLFEYGRNDKQYRVSNERAMLRTAEGSIILSFMNLNEKNWLWRDELRDALPGTRLPHYAMRSTDGGATWGNITMLHEDWTGDVRCIIQTRRGRIIVSSMKLIHNPGHHGVLTYWSDDDGVSWRASNLIDLGGVGHHDGVIEATIEQLTDGRIWMLLRSNWGRFWQAFSEDEGASWREIRPSDIEASSSPGMLKRLASGRLMLCWNRLKSEDKRRKVQMRGGDGIWSQVRCSWFREELSAAFSSDDGQTWTDPVVLARRPGSWVSYPRLFEHKPGELWLTTMQGGLSAKMREKDFV